MALELRPAWCIDDRVLEELVHLGPWTDADGGLALERDGDQWKPGESLQLRREITLLVDPFELRQQLGLWPGAQIGVAGRWSCRTTFDGGTHTDGPSPIPLVDTVAMTIDLPKRIAGFVELETCLLVKWAADADRPPTSCPDGAMVWSDGWSTPKPERTLLLEGSEVRIPVRSVSFASQFGQSSGALWAIDLDPATALDDSVSNVVTVLINREVLERDFRSSSAAGDAGAIPDAAATGIQVDLVRALTSALLDELDGDDDWRDLEEGTVGAMVVRYLTEAFGSVEAGLRNFEEDDPSFSRELWHRFAPTSWSA